MVVWVLMLLRGERDGNCMRFSLESCFTLSMRNVYLSIRLSYPDLARKVGMEPAFA